MALITSPGPGWLVHRRFKHALKIEKRLYSIYVQVPTTKLIANAVQNPTKPHPKTLGKTFVSALFTL